VCDFGFTAEVETEKVRHNKTRSSSDSRRSHSKRSNKEEKDQRESSITRKSRTTTRDPRRIAPDPPSYYQRKMQGDKYDSPKGRSSKSKLSVDTHAQSSTPRTAASTPVSPGVRNDVDMRSPGGRKSPAAKKSPVAKIDAAAAPIPDFITQTDKFGNASTPRSAGAVVQARHEHPDGAKPHLHVDKQGKLTEKGEGLDACTETLLDSFRIMCCCLAPDDESPETASDKGDKEEVVDTIPRLLPTLHPDDQGKKCLVLDLDETLVHSSFRAVPGADFVIPVQVRVL
jgi:hypothetical protein